MKRDEKDVKMN